MTQEGYGVAYIVAHVWGRHSWVCRRFPGDPQDWWEHIERLGEFSSREAAEARAAELAQQARARGRLRGCIVAMTEAEFEVEEAFALSRRPSVFDEPWRYTGVAALDRMLAGVKRRWPRIVVLSDSPIRSTEVALSVVRGMLDGKGKVYMEVPYPFLSASRQEISGGPADLTLLWAKADLRKSVEDLWLASGRVVAGQKTAAFLRQGERTGGSSRKTSWQVAGAVIDGAFRYEGLLRVEASGRSRCSQNTASSCESEYERALAWAERFSNSCPVVLTDVAPGGGGELEELALSLLDEADAVFAVGEGLISRQPGESVMDDTGEGDVAVCDASLEGESASCVGAGRPAGESSGPGLVPLAVWRRVEGPSGSCSIEREDALVSTRELGEMPRMKLSPA